MLYRLGFYDRTFNVIDEIVSHLLDQEFGSFLPPPLIFFYIFQSLVVLTDNHVSHFFATRSSISQSTDAFLMFTIQFTNRYSANTGSGCG